MMMMNGEVVKNKGFMRIEHKSRKKMCSEWF